ncbi:hypothetical protein U1Q18_005840 [Sarracenia purpurea var. burkii]
MKCEGLCFWIPAKAASQSDELHRLNHHKEFNHKEEAFQNEAPNQLFEGAKQFSMSYHKTSQRSNKGTNGTTHIAQLGAVPGFTCFVSENHSSQKTEEDKSVPLPKVHAKSPPEIHGNLTKERTSDGTAKFGSQSSRDKFNSIDNSFGEKNPKTHPSKVSSPSSIPVNLVANKSEPKRSIDSNFKVPKSYASKAGPGYCSPSSSDEELDVNSTAAASAAALRKAVENAQASIRIAKEFMERKKDGPQRFSKPSSRSGLDVKNRMEDVITIEASRIIEKKAKETCESADVVFQVFTKSGREKARRSGKVAPNLAENEGISVANGFVKEKNENKFESAEDCEAMGLIPELADRSERRTATLTYVHADDRNNIMLTAASLERKETEIGKKILEQIDESGKKVHVEGQKLEDLEGNLNKVNTEQCREKEIEIGKKTLEQLHKNGKKVDEEAQKLEDLEGKLNAVKTARDWEQHVYKLDPSQEVHEQEENEKAGISQEDDETERIKASTAKEIFHEEQNRKSPKDNHEEESEYWLKKICKHDGIKKGLQASCLWVDNEERTPDGEEIGEREEDGSDLAGNEKILIEVCEYEDTESIQRENGCIETIEVNQVDFEKMMNLDATSNACKWDAGESMSKNEEAHRHKHNDNGSNFQENERISDVSQPSCEFKMDENGLVGGVAESIEIEHETNNTYMALLFRINPQNIIFADANFGPKQTDQNEKESELPSNLGSSIKTLMCEPVEGEKRVDDETAFDLEEVKGEEKTIEIDEDIQKTQITEKHEETLNNRFTIEDKETEVTQQREVLAEKQLRKNEEASKREREREKDRLAVERAVREARERAFAEARERAERAAVERATAEARKRVMAEAQEKFEKASAANKLSAEKASIEAKLRAERAAVERATAEARERALEKALSQKATNSGSRDQAERFVAEKFSGVSRDNGMRQSFPSSDTQRLDETNNESALRRKAILERHHRTMARAAKALAEKNARDLLAQKEQAEKNRLAETLDAEVKRWSSGKEGNLRALLSTLQYILGSDSGWQPISLTDIITTNAVKKAYRKATLQVHPDKLQQRGASIHQKYICEKVFDLLKAAWNKFNSEER